MIGCDLLMAALLLQVVPDVEARIQKLEERVVALERQSQDVSQLYDRSASTSASATSQLETARKRFVAAANVEQSNSTFAARLAVAQVITTATLTALAGPHGVCANQMSTRTYRLRHEVPRGYDVDHVIPKAYAGADNALNYQVLPESLNRSLGSGMFGKEPQALLLGLGASVLSALCF